MLLAEFDFESTPLEFYRAPNGEPVVSAGSLVAALKGDARNAARIARNNVRAKWLIELPTPNGGKPKLCLFEPGAYQLAGNPMFQTDLAERFQDWLFEEVLPKLRSRSGIVLDQDRYLSTASAEEVESWKTMAEAEQQKRLLLQEENDRLKKTIEATPVLARAEATKTQMEVIALIHIEIDRHSIDCANDQQYKISLLYHNYCQDLVRYIEDGFPPAVGLKYLDLANDTFEATFEPIRKSHAPWNFTSRWRTLEVETSEYYKKFLAEQAKASKTAKAA